MAKKPTQLESDKDRFDDVLSILSNTELTDKNFATEIQKFAYEEFIVRVVNIDGETWFVANDVCEVLTIQNARRAVKEQLDSDDVRSTYVIDSVGREQATYIINESGLYNLIFQSRKPEAKVFKKWVTSEVLPSIRKTGRYEIPNLKQMSEDERRLVIREQIKEHNPRLSAEAQKAGVGNTGNPQKDNYEFAIFHNKGYQGLYGGLGKRQIARKKGVPETANILDYMNSTELAANFFRVTQTEERLKNSEIFRKEDAYDLHELVGKKVRAAMIEIGGMKPENIPFVESIKKIEKKKPSKIIEETTTKINPPKIVINISRDLWKVALLIMSTKPAGIINTRELIEEIPNYIEIPEGQLEKSNVKNEPKYYQIIRNLKSNKSNKTSLFSRGYVTDIRGGFQITPKGLDFVKKTFKDFL